MLLYRHNDPEFLKILREKLKHHSKLDYFRGYTDGKRNQRILKQGKCPVRPRTRKMASPEDAIAVWKLLSPSQPRTSRLGTGGRERPEGVSAGSVV